MWTQIWYDIKESMGFREKLSEMHEQGLREWRGLNFILQVMTQTLKFDNNGENFLSQSINTQTLNKFHLKIIILRSTVELFSPKIVFWVLT